MLAVLALIQRDGRAMARVLVTGAAIVVVVATAAALRLGRLSGPSPSSGGKFKPC